MPTSLSEALARLAEPGTSWDDFADVWHVRHRGALRHVCVAVGDGPWEVLHGTPTDDLTREEISQLIGNKKEQEPASGGGKGGGKGGGGGGKGGRNKCRRGKDGGKNRRWK